MKKILVFAILLTIAVAISATVGYNAGREKALLDSSVWVTSGTEDGVLQVWLELEEKTIIHKAEFWPSELRERKW